MKLRSALIEAAAVLLGVLGAFAIDAWWDRSQEAARADAYLEALAPELAGNDASLGTYLGYHAEELERADTFLTRASVEPPVPSDSLLVYLGIFGPPRRVPLETSALADILGSGGLSTIRDESLRRAIGRYERVLTDLRNSELQAAEFWRDQMFPFHVQHFDLRLGGLGSDAEMRAEAVPAEPFLSREYANLLLARRWHTGVVAFQADSLQDRGRELDRLLADRWGSTPRIPDDPPPPGP